MGEPDPENEVSKAEENGNLEHEKNNFNVTEKSILTNSEVDVLKDGAVKEIGGFERGGEKEGNEKEGKDQVAAETKEIADESKAQNKDTEKLKVEEDGASNKNEVTNVKEDIKVEEVDKVDVANRKVEETEKWEAKQLENEGTNAEKVGDRELEKADDKEVGNAEDKEKEKANDKRAEETKEKKDEVEDDNKDGEKKENKEEEKVEENDLKEADDKDEEMVNGDEENKIQKKDEEMAECKEESTEEREEDQEKEEEDVKEVEMEDKEAEEEEEIEKKSKVEKGSKKRGREMVNNEKAKRGEKESNLKEPQLKTPTSDRPIRERKSVERLVASIENDNAKEFHIEKGCGTPLKDIPNVSFKLSRKKTDDTFKLLHSILFGRRGKAVEIKSNISRFSGFVWLHNEEKQKTKVREKFDKCNKEKLLEFCDLLDIPITKATARKEDIVVKLIDFLVSPHPTTDVLLAENESSKGKKRKRVVKCSSSTSGHASSKSKAKSQKRNEDSSRTEKDKATSNSEDESEEEQDNNKENENKFEKSEDQMAEHSGSEGRNDSGDESEDVGKEEKNSTTSSKRKEPATKIKNKKVPHKSSVRSRRTPNKSSSTHRKMDKNDDETSPKVFSRKKSNGKETKEKNLTPSKSISREKPGSRAIKGKGKYKEDKMKPSDDKLREATCEILKEVDFNTATFTDILKQLAKQFNTDLTPKKASIKLMIQEELTKLADEADDEDEGDIEKDENPSAPEFEV